MTTARGNNVEGKKYTVGIVDDTKMTRTATEKLFNMAGNFSVRTGEDGIEAVEMVDLGGGIDAMVIDYKMRVMDGAEAIAEIKKRNGNIVAILYSTNDVADKAEACGADAYVNKIRAVNKQLPQIVRELIETGYSITLEQSGAEDEEHCCWQRAKKPKSEQESD